MVMPPFSRFRLTIFIVGQYIINSRIFQSLR
nr:MAG TPA: hypothetical protein [Caudoviricetes sp.]